MSHGASAGWGSVAARLPRTIRRPLQRRPISRSQNMCRQFRRVKLRRRSRNHRKCSGEFQHLFISIFGHVELQFFKLQNLIISFFSLI